MKATVPGQAKCVSKDRFNHMLQLFCQLWSHEDALPMLPVCLRHAPNNLTEDEHPVHLVFLDRVPR